MPTTHAPPQETPTSARRAVLLTGATGFLGRELLWRLLDELPLDVDVLCLIRGDAKDPKEGTPALRLATLLAGREHPAGAGPSADEQARMGRVLAIGGDMTLPKLGLSEDAFAALAARVTTIYHGAATVRFDLPLPEARRTNVGGTREILMLAQRAHENGHFERLHYIGTAYIAGKRTGLIRESDCSLEYGFHNTYEQTKCEAELLVREAMQRQALPVTIYRPSIIVGDSQTGYTSSFKVMYWPLKIFSRGLIPIVPASRAGRVDLVPVDYVVDAIWELSQLPGALGQCYHLAAGPEQETTIGAAMEVAARFFGVYKPLFMPTAAFERYVRPVLNLLFRGKRRQVLDAGRIYVPYLNYRGSFDTTKARRDLRASGLQVPSVREYFETLMRFCVASDWGKRPVPPPT